MNKEEFRTAFFFVKPHKATGYDNINVNIIKKTYNELKAPLLRSLILPLSTETFPDKLKIIRASPIFKNGEKERLTSYQSISILSYVSKKSYNE